MATQSTITVSPDGRYIAAQVHQLWAIVEQSTGAVVSLPAPVFSRVVEGEGDADDDEQEGEGEDQPEGEANEGGEDAAKPAASAAAAASKAKAASSGGSKGGQRSHEGPKPVRVLAFHPDPATPWLLVNTEEKYIHLYHMHASYETGFKHILTVVIPRKVQACTFHPGFAPSSKHVDPSGSGALQLPRLIVADKTGDIFSLQGTDLSLQKLELAHLANITHVDFYRAPGTKAAKHLAPANSAPAAASVEAQHKPHNYFLSADSDGKIRVSKSPNYFDIQSFCLGHQAFVSTFVVLPLAHPLIVSGGLGSELMLWNLATGTRLACFDLAPHKPGSEAAAAGAGAAASSASASSSAAATPAAVVTGASSIAESVTQSCYISNISLAPATTDGKHTLAVSVYPWSHIFHLSYTPASESHFEVTSVESTPTTPMCLQLVGTSSAAATPRLMYIDQQLEVHVLRRGTQCGKWKDASATGDAAAQAAVKATLASFATAFAPSRASLSDTLITDENAAEFIGGGTGQPKNEPLTAEQEARAAAAAAAGNTGRYISPFSSLHSNHLQRLGMLSAPGFAFRRFFDKLQRDRYISGRRADAIQRKEANKRQKVANKAANRRQKKADAEAEAAEDQQ